MIHFFRRIRQGLINKERAGKYLLYAVGEILLVVIGILLALQINNWNKKNNDRIEERHYLSRFIQDLTNDLTEINNVAESNQYRLHQCMMTLDSLGVKLPSDRHYSDLRKWNSDLGIDTITMLNVSFGNGLNRVRMYDEFNTNDDTYQELLSNGRISLLRDQNLKLSVINHYTNLENRLQLVQKIQMMRDDYVKTLADQGISMYNDMSFSELENLMENKKQVIAEIENIFYITRSNQFTLKYDEESLEKKTENLIALIENYLNEKSRN